MNQSDRLADMLQVNMDKRAFVTMLSNPEFLQISLLKIFFPQKAKTLQEHARALFESSEGARPTVADTLLFQFKLFGMPFDFDMTTNATLAVAEATLLRETLRQVILGQPDIFDKAAVASMPEQEEK